MGEPERYTGSLTDDPGQEACMQGLRRSWGPREETQSPLEFPQGEGLTGSGVKANRGRAREVRSPGWGPAGSPELCCPRLPSLAASLGLLGMLSLSLCHLRFPLCEARSKKIHKN